MTAPTAMPEATGHDVRERFRKLAACTPSRAVVFHAEYHSFA